MADLVTFATETPSQSKVLGLDGDALCVDGSQIGVFKEGDEVGFSRLLKSHDGRGLEAKIGLRCGC